MAECTSAWLGESLSAYEMTKDYWVKNIFPRGHNGITFQTFWDNAVHDGYAKLDGNFESAETFDVAALKPVTSSSELSGNEYTLALYSSILMQDGKYSYNPFLLELPDPVAKLTWDNFASVSAKTAEKLGVEDADILRIKAGFKGTLEVPVYVQYGQHVDTISVALGYGS